MPMVVVRVAVHQSMLSRGGRAATVPAVYCHHRTFSPIDTATGITSSRRVALVPGGAVASAQDFVSFVATSDRHALEAFATLATERKQQLIAMVDEIEAQLELVEVAMGTRPARTHDLFVSDFDGG